MSVLTKAFFGWSWHEWSPRAAARWEGMIKMRHLPLEHKRRLMRRQAMRTGTNKNNSPNLLHCLRYDKWRNLFLLALSKRCLWSAGMANQRSLNGESCGHVYLFQQLNWFWPCPSNGFLLGMVQGPLLRWTLLRDVWSMIMSLSSVRGQSRPRAHSA